MCWAKCAPPALQSSPCCVNSTAYPALLLGIWVLLVFCAALLPWKAHGQGWCGCLCAGGTAGCTKIIRGGFSLPHQPIVVWRAASCLLGLQLQVLPQVPWLLPDMVLGHQPAGSGPLHSHFPPWYCETCLGQLRSPLWPSGVVLKGLEASFQKCFRLCWRCVVAPGVLSKYSCTEIKGCTEIAQ